MPRRLFDHYETPPHYVEPLLELIGPLDELTIYEPCVGAGHIARHLTNTRLITNDLDPSREADTHHDARHEAAWPTDDDAPYDWTITNPPFSDELAILTWALASSRNVAFLARLSFLEPTQTRGEFWKRQGPSDLIVLPRYSFRRNDLGKTQTDSVTCCWLIFREGLPACVHFSTARTYEEAYAET